jgi:hypothetical protein
VAVICHFDASLGDVEAAFKKSRTPMAIFASAFDRTELSDAGKLTTTLEVSLILSEVLPATVRDAPPAKSPPLTILVAEFHPMPARNEALERYAQSLPQGAELRVSEALDSPVLQQFMGPEVIPLLERLGLDQNEAISYAMLDHAINNAISKISAEVTQEQRAASVDDWFRKNLRRTNA